MKIDPARIRAARALLDWTQDRLAMAAGLSALSISNIEKGAQDPSARTLDKIRRALEAGGAFFTPAGVEYRPGQILSLPSYIEVLEDAARILPSGGEILCHCAAGARSTDAVRNAKQDLARRGVTFRYTVRAGDTDLPGAPGECRAMPADIFAGSEVMLFYADTVALDGGDAFLIFRSASLSAALRRQLLEFWWMRGERIEA